MDDAHRAGAPRGRRHLRFVPDAAADRGAPAATPAVATRRYEGLEAYRGVAALLIVLYHAYQHSRAAVAYVYEGTPLHPILRNLEVGVAWFFVLSGFLIFLPFARAAIEQRGAQSARGFLVRRAIRILPLYYAAILVVWSLRNYRLPGEWLDLLEHLTFTQIFDAQRIFWTIGPAWSLAVEALFYLFVAAAGPLAYRACGKLATRRARVSLLAGGAAALLVCSVAYKWWAARVAGIPAEDYPVYFGPVAKLDTFALGMLLAVWAAAGRGALGGPAPALLRAGGVAILAASFALRLSTPVVDLYVHTLSGAAFAMVLASTVLGPRGSGWERALASRPLQYLGVISYSVYLWHEPIMLQLARLVPFERGDIFPVGAAVLVLASVAVGSLSYWGVEYPASALRHLFARDGRVAERYTAIPAPDRRRA